MRPVGVTLVGFYQILRGVIALVFGFFILFYQGPANKFTSVAAHGNVVERLLSRLSHTAGLVIIVFVILHILAGYGVLQVRNWGRTVALLFSGIELLLMVPGIVRVNIFSVVLGAINAACVFYLIMPPIGRAFRGGGSTMRVAV
jgi:uncharacterized membrane protein (DUF2068 family)